MRYLAILLLIGNLHAGEVTYIKKGEPAPENGYFITVAQEKKFRQLNEENKKLTKINIQLKDLQVQQDAHISILNDRLNNYKADNEYLSKRIESARSDGFWNRTIYFIGGVALMGGATYLAGRIK